MQYKKNDKKKCLRCGKDYVRLDNHIKKKNICEAIYLNISYENMMENYNSYFKDFNTKLLSKLHKCNCGKFFKYRSGLSRHKKNCNGNINNNTANDSTNIINNTYNTNNINININNENIFNIVPQNFGEEILPTIIAFFYV